MFMYIIKILNVLWLEARAKRVFCRIQTLYIKVKYLEIFKELWASCSILMIGFKCSMFDIVAFSILKLQNENGVVTLTFTFSNNWKWSFMTVEFAIPYLPQSKKSGVCIVILGCLFRKLIHSLDGPLLVLPVTSSFPFLIISLTKAWQCLMIFFHYAFFFLLITTKIFFFNLLISYAQCSCVHVYHYFV